MQFKTIQNVRMDSDYTTHWGGTCMDTTTYTYMAPNPGVGETLSFNPTSIEQYRTPEETPKVSFKKIRQSGAIKMTDYVNSKRTVRRSLVRVPRELATLGWPSCGDLSWVGNQVKLITSYEEVGDLNYWSKRYPSFASRSVLEHADVVEATKAAVVAANLSTYDLLTEMAEAKETLAMVVSILRAVRRPLEAFKAFEQSLRKNGHLSKQALFEALQKKWMEYRYAIMPAFYSIQDISKLVKERNNAYKTDKEKQVLPYNRKSDVPLLNRYSSYIYQEVSGTTTVRAVAKARFNLSNLNLRLFDQVGLNPFVTAWELLPFSFVVDWFINVGDWVQAQTSSLVDLAEQRSFCYSIKHDLTVLTKLRVDEVERFTKDYPQLGGSVVHEHSILVDEILETETITHYERHVFYAHDTKLVSDAFLDWRRMIDAFVLTNKPLFQALRSLK